MAWGDLVLVSIAPAITAITLLHRRRATDLTRTDGSLPIGLAPSLSDVSFFRLMTFAPLIALSWAAVRLLAGEGGYRESGEVIEMKPDGVFFLLPAVFMAMSAGSLLQDLHFRRKGAVAYPFPSESVYSSNRLAEHEWQLWLCSLIAVGSILFSQCLHVSIDPTRIELGTAFSLYSRSYPYSDVAFVRTAPGFKSRKGVKRMKSIAIGFTDGSVWSTRDLPTELVARQVERVAQVVSGKAGIAIERKKTLTGSGR